MTQEKIDELEKRVVKLENYQDTTYEQYEELVMRRKPEPYKCPVCNGEGSFLCSVDPSFIMNVHTNHYIDDLGRTFKACISCEGKGIVWG